MASNDGREVSARQRIVNVRPSDVEEEDSDENEELERNKSTFFSKMFATLLILPGIVLYVYILYIVLSNLLYPASLAPFLNCSRLVEANFSLGEPPIRCKRPNCLIFVA